MACVDKAVSLPVYVVKCTEQQDNSKKSANKALNDATPYKWLPCPEFCVNSYLTLNTFAQWVNRSELYICFTQNRDL